MKIKFTIYIVFILLISMSSCEKYFDVPPVGQVSEDNYYKNINDLQTGLYAAYAVLKEQTFQQTLALLGDGISDDFIYQFSLNNTFGVDGYKMEQFNISSDNVWVLNWYQENYKGIYRVNQVLRHIEDSIPITYSSSDNYSIVMWRHIYGQLLFLRGYYYFNLVKAFGGVPIQPVTPVVGKTTYPRAGKDSVYAYIEQDLRLATLLLDENPGNGSSGGNKVDNTMHYNEPSKFSSLALLTKVLIYQAKPGILSDKWREAKKIDDCLFSSILGGSGTTLTFNDVLKLSVNFKGTTWPELVTRFKFDKILQSDINDSSNFAEYKKPDGSGILIKENLANKKGFFAWDKIWRVQYQNSGENHSVLFCAPSFNSPVFSEYSFTVTTFLDALYGVQHNDANPLAPTTSLRTEMDKENGDPRKWYGIVTHDHGGIPSWPPGFPTSMQFGGIGEENNLLILKRFLWAGSELGSDDNASPRNLTLMRYNEYALFYAEALNECGQNIKAIDIMNAMREALVTALPPINTNFTTKLGYGPYEYTRDAIWHERRVELCAEFDRFWDIVRQGRAAEIMNGTVEDQAISKQGLKFTKGVNELLPIPATEIELSNNVITQNPGY
jgi:starch-binding outer membrane protein, SusD/RagB family